MNPDSLKIGVIGAGVFGSYHAVKCAAHSRVDFIGIYDPDENRANAAAKKNETRAYHNCNAIIADSDALIVACPAVHHGPIAIAALKAGRHVLVEKPIAAKLENASTMVSLAKEQKLVLQVDHQERFVAQAIGLDKADRRPTNIRATRFGPVSIRGLDVSVTLDLMTHDIDLVCWLMGGAPVSVSGDAIKVYSEQPDASRALLRFDNGCIAHLEASRAEQDRARKMELVYPDGKLEIDFVAKTFNNTTQYPFNPNFIQNPLAADSLGASVDSFIHAVLDGDPVFIDGDAGLLALEVALQVDGNADC